jgi:hypothetical protein
MGIYGLEAGPLVRCAPLSSLSTTGGTELFSFFRSNITCRLSETMKTRFPGWSPNTALHLDADRERKDRHRTRT